MDGRRPTYLKCCLNIGAGKMVERISAGGLQVAKPLHDFIQTEALPGSGVDATAFWDALGNLIHDLAPKNRALLAKREELQ